MSQKLFTKEVQAQAGNFPLYSQDAKGDDAVVWAKFFHPVGRYTAYVTEMDVKVLEEKGNLQKVEGQAFGFCLSPFGPDCDELGYFDLAEWVEYRGKFGLGIERDMYWTPITLGEVKAKINEQGAA